MSGARLGPAARRGSTFVAIGRKQRSQLVREQLEQAIARGEFKPGDRLPSERELAEVLEVSRVSVREAMRSLEALGVVECHQGRGCFVTASRADGYATPFAHWVGVHRDEVLELLRVRGALDEVAAEDAAAGADVEEVERVRASAEAFAAAVRDDLPVEELVALDIAFHEAVAAASGSRLLVNLLRDLNTYLNESRHAAFAPKRRPHRSAEEHARIVKAIADGRPTQARAAAARHIEAVRRAMIDLALVDGREPTA